MSLPRIALNGRFSGTHQPTGAQTAAFWMLDAIVRLERNLELVIFADSRFPGISEWHHFPGVIWVEVPFQDWSRTQAQLWEQLIFPFVSRHYGCTAAHHPMLTNPVWNNGLSTLITVNDLNFMVHPEWYHWTFRWFLRLCAIPGLRRARHVRVISRYIEEQVWQQLQLPRERLGTIYCGVKTPQFARSSSAPPPAGVPHILCVGSLQPHKNLIRLCEAFQQLRREGIVQELRVVGRPQTSFCKIPGLEEMLRAPGVVILGYLSEEELFNAYAQSTVFCFPSLEEGFGMPILEAMQAGTLVVTSRTSCLPEIAGSAARLVDPTNVNEIAEGLREMLQLDPASRQQRVTEGKAWAATFTWERCGRAYLELYQDILLPPSAHT